MALSIIPLDWTVSVGHAKWTALYRFSLMDIQFNIYLAECSFDT